jgi:hypothetical protein
MEVEGNEMMRSFLIYTPLVTSLAHFKEFSITQTCNWNWRNK